MPNIKLPDEVKRSRGTLRADRVNPAAPEPPHGAPEPPEYLSAAALALWGEYTPILMELRVLSKADRFALEMLCETHAEVIRLRGRLAELGVTSYTTTARSGGEIRRSHPEAIQLSDSERRLRGWLTEFGLTPASRSKVSKIVERKASKFDVLDFPKKPPHGAA